MLTHQRETAIVERIRTAGSATVEELSALLDVSGTTVRRDLERLELSGSVRRVHGGATLPEAGHDDLEDLDADAGEKRAIAARPPTSSGTATSCCSTSATPRSRSPGTSATGR